jgi:hypothetical protein
VPAEAGVPVSVPVAMLKVAHAGLLLIEKLWVVLEATVGVKLYATPDVALVAGEPDIDSQAVFQ